MHKNLAPLIGDRTLADEFERDVLRGLARPPGEKSIPAKHLYDARGSALFERICALEEYYPTRLEATIFERCLDDVALRLGRNVVLVEPGAGSGEKAERLLAALNRPRSFAPIEISAAALRDASERIAGEMPRVVVHPVRAEFVRGLELLQHLPRAGRVVFFPGSTIGNLLPDERVRLLREFAHFVGAGGAVLVTYDMIKPVDVLLAAYDDGAGVTAEFDLNLLVRINRELAGDIDVAAFRHRAVWNEPRERIEMHLVCRSAQRATIRGQRVSFAAGEAVHTENSHKFTPTRIATEAAAAGLDVTRTWSDPRDWMRVVLLTVPA